MVGLDTGFFVALMEGEERAVALWDELSLRSDPPIVSVLSLGEILYLSYRAGRPAQGRRMVQGIEMACSVKDVGQETVLKAAGLKHGRGIPYVDSLILATFLLGGCDEIHTSDRGHFKRRQKGSPRVIEW
jgi:predicted nucleic acid-binding protein